MPRALAIRHVIKRRHVAVFHVPALGRLQMADKAKAKQRRAAIRATDRAAQQADIERLRRFEEEYARCNREGLEFTDANRAKVRKMIDAENAAKEGK